MKKTKLREDDNRHQIQKYAQRRWHVLRLFSFCNKKCVNDKSSIESERVTYERWKIQCVSLTFLCIKYITPNHHLF